MIALSGPKLKLYLFISRVFSLFVSMIALSGPKLKLVVYPSYLPGFLRFNDSTEWA